MGRLMWKGEFDIELVRGVNTKETDNWNVCKKPEEGENIFYPTQETNRHKLSKSRSFLFYLQRFQVLGVEKFGCEVL